MDYLEDQLEEQQQQRFYDDIYDEEEEFIEQEEDHDTIEDQEMSPAKSKYDSNQLKLDIATARERVCITIFHFL